MAIMFEMRKQFVKMLPVTQMNKVVIVVVTLDCDSQKDCTMMNLSMLVWCS